MRSSRQAPPPAAEPEPAVDPGILAFGTSVSVNDDLRRSIHAEVEEIDKSIANTMKQVKGEEKLQDELRKSRAMSVKESHGILEGVTENVGTLSMHCQLLGTLEKSFHANISSQGESTTTKVRADSSEQPTTTNGTSSPSENLPPTFGLSVESLQKKHLSIETGLVSVKEAVVACSQELRDLVVEKQARVDATDELRNRMEAENLAGRLDELTEKTRYGEGVKQSEMKRRSTLLANRDAAEGRVREAEKSKQAMADEVSSQKQKLSAIKAEYDKKTAKAHEKMHHAKTMLESLQTDAAAAKAERIQAEKRLHDAKESIKRREKMKTQREGIRSARVALAAEKERLEAAIAKSKKNMEQSKRTILKTEKEAVAVEAEKEKNDTMQAEQVLPGGTEYKEVCKQIEAVKARIKEVQANPEVPKLEAEVETATKELESWKETLQGISDEISEKKSKASEFQRILDDHNDAVGKELDALAVATKEVDEQYASEQARLEEAEQLLRELEAETTHVALYRKLQILRAGAERLKLTAQREKEICD